MSEDSLPSGSSKKGLIFVEIEVIGNCLNALMDTGDSSLFIVGITVKKVYLKLEKDTAYLKIVNSVKISTIGTAREVDV